MNVKLWILLAVLLIVAGVLFGGALAGLLGIGATAAAVQAARKKERDLITAEQELQQKKQERIEQIKRDIKMESKVLQHKTNAELKREILNDLDELDTRR